MALQQVISGARKITQEITMFTVTGITGQVGGTVAQTLLAAGKSVRGIVRDPQNASAWQAKGCELFAADLHDASALGAAFAAAEGVFVMLPPIFDPSPGFPECRQLAAVLRKALEAAQPPKIVCLSSIGAQAIQTSLLTQLQILEQELRTFPVIAFLRPAWFMENFAWDVAPARETGTLRSFLQPLDRSFPMVATRDVGRTAAELLLQPWQGQRIIELEGPERITPLQVATIMTHVLERDVRAEAVPGESWEAIFQSQGMKNPIPRMQMLEGFNQGWIDFEGGKAEPRRGKIHLDEVLRSLASKEN
jgi:uncharacterized protein YbjT (DUF2867 family)